MSKTRNEVWMFINEYYDVHKYMPCSQEIADALGKSVNTIQSHMRGLLDDGMIATELTTRNQYGECTRTAWASRGYRFGRRSKQI